MAAPPPPPPYCVATPTADIGVTANADQPSYVVGSMVNYTLDVFVVREGRTYCTANDARLAFQVPPQLGLNSIAASTEQGRCEVSGALVTCYFGSIDADNHVKVNVSAKADTVGKIDALAGVSEADADPDTGNQTYSASAIITPAQPVEQSKAALSPADPPPAPKPMASGTTAPPTSKSMVPLAPPITSKPAARKQQPSSDRKMMALVPPSSP
jgi:hypothetical protein